MRPKYCAVVLCLLSVFAMGQNPGNAESSTATPIHGIKILSSSLDSSASPQRVQLEFINDSTANITAWGYCVRAEKANDIDPYQGFCTMTDAASIVVDREIQERMTRKQSPADCPHCSFVHPGEHKIIFATFARPVTSAEIQINLIVYSNGKVETSGPDGLSNLQQLTGRRQRELKETQELVDMGKKILADPANSHPSVSMVNELQSRLKDQPGMVSALRAFKRPEWRQGSEKEFIPDDERGYLAKFVSEQEMRASELSKHQIQEVSQ